MSIGVENALRKPFKRALKKGFRIAGNKARGVFAEEIKNYFKTAIGDLIKAVVITAAIELIKDRVVTPAAQRINDLSSLEGEDPVYDLETDWWGDEIKK